MLPHHRPAPRCGERAVVRLCSPCALALATSAARLASVCALWLWHHSCGSYSMLTKFKEGNLAAKYLALPFLLVSSPREAAACNLLHVCNSCSLAKDDVQETRKTTFTTAYRSSR